MFVQFRIRSDLYPFPLYLPQATAAAAAPSKYIHALVCISRMRGILNGVQKLATAKNLGGRDQTHVFTRFGCKTSSPAMPERGLDNITVADVLMTKGDEKVGSWLWCHTNDTVENAMKNMARHNVGSLVVLKPGEQQHIAGIITERDYLRKIIGQESPPAYTRVGDIMTDESKLITVTSDTSILQAMQLMTDNHIRHAPVIDGKVVGMISIVDVVRAVVEQQNGELKRLNEFIRGDYY